MIRLFALALVVSSTACVSFFQPHALDMGRGSAPLKPGTLQAHGGVAGGLPAGLAGVGVEGQIASDLAVGFDVSTGGLQNDDVGLIIPSGTFLTAQYNPAGWDSLAVRGSAGMGLDILPGQTHAPSAPWLAATGGVVTSSTFGAFEPYLALNLGFRRYLGGPDAEIVVVPKVNNIGLVETTFSGGGTAGLRMNLGDSLAVYGSASLSALVLSPESVDPNVQVEPTITATSNGQLGVSYTF